MEPIPTPIKPTINEPIPNPESNEERKAVVATPLLLSSATQIAIEGNPSE
jgi:hypothetical protein